MRIKRCHWRKDVRRVYRLDGCMAHIKAPIGIAIELGYEYRVVYGSSQPSLFVKAFYKELGKPEWRTKYFPASDCGFYGGRKEIHI